MLTDFFLILILLYTFAKKYTNKQETSNHENEKVSFNFSLRIDLRNELQTKNDAARHSNTKHY